jgi:hypothetical protein
MPWQVVLLMLVITAFAVVGFCILTGAEPDKGKKAAPVPWKSHWWELPVALTILLFGLAVVDLTEHSGAIGRHIPVLTGR